MSYREEQPSTLSTPPAGPVKWIVWEIKRPRNDVEVTAQLASEACSRAVLFDVDGVSLHPSQMDCKQLEGS